MRLEEGRSGHLGSVAVWSECNASHGDTSGAARVRAPSSVDLPALGRPEDGRTSRLPYELTKRGHQVSTRPLLESFASGSRVCPTLCVESRQGMDTAAHGHGLQRRRLRGS